MEKLSEAQFKGITQILSAITIGAFLGWLMFWVVGSGREYYQTSTPIELYGSFGWFTFSYYCAYIFMTCLILILILPNRSIQNGRFG
jgi:hypothetical protein